MKSLEYFKASKQTRRIEFQYVLNKNLEYYLKSFYFTPSNIFLDSENLEKITNSLKSQHDRNDDGCFLHYPDILDSDDRSSILVSHNMLIKQYTRHAYKEILFHEAFIGLRVGNEMRKLIPNFVWTFGIFNDKLFIEYLQGDELEIIDQDCASQIIPALIMANELFDFSHYDLHPKNIIKVKISDYPFYIKYVIKNKDYYVSTNGYIYVIIDFGNSYALIDNHSHGSPNNLETCLITDKMNRFTDKSYLNSDIIKLLSQNLTLENTNFIIQEEIDVLFNLERFKKEYSFIKWHDKINRLDSLELARKFIDLNITIEKPDIPIFKYPHPKLIRKNIKSKITDLNYKRKPDSNITLEFLEEQINYMIIRGSTSIIEDFSLLKIKCPENLYWLMEEFEELIFNTLE